MELKVEKITPAMAKKYLRENNTNNYRKISRNQVNRYAADMKAGKWELNGEAIQFGADGTLKNGQHRLAAIVLAGVPVEMTVIRGIDSNVKMYDVGGLRTVSQIASGKNLNVDKTLASAAGIIANNFQINIRGKTVDYIEKNINELNRAMRATGTSSARLRRATCVVAAYLMLRSETMPFYEVELFFQVFNTENTRGTDGYEPSGALIAKAQIKERSTAGQKSQKEQLDILCQALMDFHQSRARTSNYKVAEPFSFEGMMKKVREKDGVN